MSLAYGVMVALPAVLEQKSVNNLAFCSVRLKVVYKSKRLPRLKLDQGFPSINLNGFTSERHVTNGDRKHIG